MRKVGERMDREKVIKGLGYCLTIDSPCGDCPYYSYEDIQELDCERNLRHDALELLKEQEAKTGHWIDSAGNDRCSICGEEYSDLYPDYGNTHFCPNCGAKMECRQSE